MRRFFLLHFHFFIFNFFLIQISVVLQKHRGFHSPEFIQGHMAATRADTLTAAGEPGVAHEVEHDAVELDSATKQLARRLQRLTMTETATETSRAIITSQDAISNLVSEHSVLVDLAARVMAKARDLKKSEQWDHVATWKSKDYKEMITKISALINDFVHDVNMLIEKELMFENKRFMTSGGVKSLTLMPVIHCLKKRHGMLQLSREMLRTELKSKRFKVYQKPIDRRLDDLHDTIDAMQQLAIFQEEVQIDPA